MRNKEAKEMIVSIKDNNNYDSNIKDALQCAVYALDKQIPKEPERPERSGMGYIYNDFACPKCGRIIAKECERVRHVINYCDKCGQRIIQKWKYEDE